MGQAVELGRVAVLDRGESARRVLRAIREASGAAGVPVALHVPGDARARFVWEAAAAVPLTGTLEEALRAARADSAWMGAGPLADRTAFAETCARAGVRFLGPPVDTLRRLSAPGAIAALASELGVPAAPATRADARARVVEVVVARDHAGAARALGVGDASLRRGDLAVLAESPSPALSGPAEATARELAVRACAAAGWQGVAVVRLLLEPRGGALALLALDAFAHSAPAIEALAQVDLVRLALRLALGAPLDGEVPAPRGHAFAARISSQDPEAPFAPAPGTVELLRLPSALGIRSEAAVAEGDEAPSDPDAPIATIVARGADRAEAAARLSQALADADVLLRSSGTSKAWLTALAARPEVRGGEAGAGFLDDLGASGARLVQPALETALLAAAIDAYEAELDLERARFLAEARRGRPRVGPSSGRSVELRAGGKRYRLDVRQTGPDTFRVAAGRSPTEVRVERIGRGERRIDVGGKRYRVLSSHDGLRSMVHVDGVPHAVAREPAGLVVSPLPAVVVAIAVVPGQRVAAGEPIARVESMKVEVVVPSPSAGIVREVLAVPNAQIDAGGPLVRLAPEDDGATQREAEPITFSSAPPEAEGTPRDRYLAALGELRRLLLGFDVADAEARRLPASLRELAAAVPVDDAGSLVAEEQALRAFVDLQSLFGRNRLPGDPASRPPLEDLWRYLHEPEQRGTGLSERFVERLRHALAHYGVSLDAPGVTLEVALLRIQKAYERVREQFLPVLGILERRLATDGAPGGFDGPDARELLERLAELGQERSPAIADLARELRYRRFDQPAFERVSADAYLQTDADLQRLPTAHGDERSAIIERVVECTQPLVTMLMSRIAQAPASVRPRLVEAQLRRYYRVRPLEPAMTLESDGLPCAYAEYELGGQRYRVIAGFARKEEAAQALRGLARLAREAPEGRAVVVEAYLWHDGAPQPTDEVAVMLGKAVSEAGLGDTVRRASVMAAFPNRGFGRQASQHHFTFRKGPDGWSEERRARGVHYMLSERMQLGRLAKFDLERLPSVEGVYLYRGVAQGNPKDERLFAAAEVRDLTPVRDAQGRVVSLPHLERMLHEALAGMRRFQARRAANQRLEWNRVLLTALPPLRLSHDEIQSLAERLAPATEGLGLETVLLDARVPDDRGELHDTLIRIFINGQDVRIRYDAPTDRPLEPMAEYQQKVVQLRRRGIIHPFEIVKMLAPEGDEPGVPRGQFVEHDLDPSGEQLVPVDRPPGQNRANIIVGIVTSFTDRYPEGVKRVCMLSDPGKAMGSLAEPECRIVNAALAKAEELKVPLEWFALSAGALISMQSGTENMDWISLTLRRIIEFTQRGGEINILITGITVGGQPYWNAEATMLMHTRGILVMTAGSSMVLTGKDALEYSGAVSAESNEQIGGYDRIMGPNGQAQYRAESIADAIQILLRHYDHSYVEPGERFPRRAPTSDPKDRDVRLSPHGPEGGAGFTTVGDIWSAQKNPDRKKPFEIRKVMRAASDQDHEPLERWRDVRGGDTAVIWDAHVGGWPVSMIGIESRPLPRLEWVPADGSEVWSAGTLFPQSSKKIARAINSASGNRALVVLANLSGFDGSPESMRRLQLEYGAEIGRAVVNFQGPIVFTVVSRYHGGAFVVFAKTLREEIEIVAIEGSRASVIGGAPAAAVVFAREVETRARKDPRIVEAEKAAAAGGAAKARLVDLFRTVRSEKVGQVAEEYDRVHTIERALKVGSVDRIIAPGDLRPYLIDALDRGIARHEQLLRGRKS